MSVHKDKKYNTWYVKYKNQTKRGFRTKTEAQQYEAKLRLDSGVIVDKIYIYDLANDYLEHYKEKVTYGTYHKVETIINTIIIPNIKNKQMNRIVELDCRIFSDYVNNLTYSTKYKNEIMNVYKRLFEYATKFYKLQNNPTYVLEPFKKTYEEKKKKANKEMSVWCDDEFKQFIQFVDKEMYKELFIILYFTGMRLGEALALTWNDYSNQSLSITKSLTRKTKKGSFEIKEPKNLSSIRKIKLGNTLDAFMYDFKQKEMKIVGFDENWYIFGRLSPLPQTNIDRAKDNAIKKANVKRIRMHDFRHSHASNLIANGTNIVAVSKRLGHSDVNMTLEVYTHLIQKSEDELVEFLEKSSHNLLTTTYKQ